MAICPMHPTKYVSLTMLRKQNRLPLRMEKPHTFIKTYSELIEFIVELCKRKEFIFVKLRSIHKNHSMLKSIDSDNEIFLVDENNSSVTPSTNHISSTLHRHRNFNGCYVLRLEYGTGSTLKLIGVMLHSIAIKKKILPWNVRWSDNISLFSIS